MNACLHINSFSTKGWQYFLKRLGAGLDTPSGLVAVLMTSFTDTPFFSSCSVLPLSVREVQYSKFFLLASYVLVFFVFQIFSLLPHSCFLGLFCCLRTLAAKSLLRESRVHAEELHSALCTCGYSRNAVWILQKGAGCVQQSGGAPWWVECSADTHSLERFCSSISERLWALSGSWFPGGEGDQTMKRTARLRMCGAFCHVLCAWLE